jgi:hypothetical protein
MSKPDAEQRGSKNISIWAGFEQLQSARDRSVQSRQCSRRAASSGFLDIENYRHIFMD